MNDFDGVEILLVEDNPHDATMTMRALKKNDFLHKLFWVKDGVEALDFVRCTGPFEGRDRLQLPKLVLLDLKMPRLDGLDVLRELKKDPQTRAIPVVVMTSSNEPRDLKECYWLGVNGFITKPVEFALFVDTIAKIGGYWLKANQTSSVLGTR
jgi:two-component system response regulator